VKYSWAGRKTVNNQSLSIKDWLICLFTYCFTPYSRRAITIACEGLQNLSLCSALRTFEQRRIFIVQILLWHRASVFPVSSKGSPLATRKGVWRTYYNQSPFSRFLRHARRCREPIQTRILTGLRNRENNLELPERGVIRNLSERWGPVYQWLSYMYSFGNAIIILYMSCKQNGTIKI
jgi:hypothetical protein